MTVTETETMVDINDGDSDEEILVDEDDSWINWFCDMEENNFSERSLNCKSPGM